MKKKESNIELMMHISKQQISGFDLQKIDEKNQLLI